MLWAKVGLNATAVASGGVLEEEEGITDSAREGRHAVDHPTAVDRCVRTKKHPQPRSATIMSVLGNTVFIQYDKKGKPKARPDKNPYTCKSVPIERITVWQPQKLGLSRENALIVDNLVRLYGKYLPALSSYEHEYSKCPAPLMRFKESKMDLAVHPLESFVLAQDLLECI